jgi:hypothetical protein
MEIKKMKDEETGLILHSKLERITVGFDADGNPVMSLVAVEAQEVLGRRHGDVSPRDLPAL